MRRIITAIVLLLLLFVLTGVAACGGDDDTDTDTATAMPAATAVTSTVPLSPGSTPRPATATAAIRGTEITAAPTDTASAGPATEPASAATRPVGGLPLVGDVTAEDGTGDVLSMADESPLDGELPGADLTSVRVTGDGATLSLTFVATTPFPTGGDAPSSEWYVDIHTDGMLYDEIKLFYAQEAWTVIYFDFRGASFSGVDLDVQPVVDGTTLSVTIPTELMPNVAAPFAWSAASSTIDEQGAWLDAVPDSATGMFYDVDELPQFP